MSKPRLLPPDLRWQLRRVRMLEDLADNLERRRRAIVATGTLLLAAAEAGWRQIELAEAVGMPQGTVHKRIMSARGRHDDHTPALVVDAPPAPTMTPHQYLLSAPAAERDWLSKTEAAALLDADPYSVGNWRRAGLLPSTRTDRQPHLYLRGELEALRGAPRHVRGGIDYAAARAALAH